MNINEEYQSEIKDFSLQPFIHLYNGTLNIIQDNFTLEIEMVKEEISLWLFPLSGLHLCLKGVLFFMMIDKFHRDNKWISMTYIYIAIGMELQANILIVKLFESSDPSPVNIFGITFGMVGWFGVLASLFFLPRPLMAL